MKAINPILVFILIIPFSLLAQQNPLNKKIMLTANAEPIIAVLNKIEQENKLYFSYSPTLLKTNEAIDFSCTNEKLSYVLKEILPDGIRMKAVNEHIILLPPEAKKKKRQQTDKRLYYFKGKVTDSLSGKPLNDVSVLLSQKNISTLSGSDGHFVLISKKAALPLIFSKAGYYDRLVYPDEKYFDDISIHLQPKHNIIRALVPIKNDRISGYSERPLVKMLVPRDAIINAENVKTYDNKAVQVSFLPYLGSNYKMSGTRTNNVSINILAGYAGGLNGTEIAGLANIISGQMNGLQFAGLSNIVGGNSKGWQTSGFFNYTGGSHRGVQIAGFSNVVFDTLSGIQVAGFINTLRGGMKGVQLAGFGNITTKNVDGAQLSGYINWAHGDVQLAQASGFFNYARGNVHMAQLSGFANMARDINGAQISGFGNIALGISTGAQIAAFFNFDAKTDGAQIAGFSNLSAGDCNGVQISALLNLAKKLRGVQIGLINIADTVEKGLPVGLLNIIWHGYHKIELSATDIFHQNISIKTGVPHFYTVLSAGYDGNNFYHAGGGFGSQFWQSKHWGATLDLTAHALFNKQQEDYAGALTQLSPAIVFRFFKWAELFAGPQVRMLISDKNQTATHNAFNNGVFHEQDEGSYKLKFSAGGKIGIRLL